MLTEFALPVPDFCANALSEAPLRDDAICSIVAVRRWWYFPHGQRSAHDLRLNVQFYLLVRQDLNNIELSMFSHRAPGSHNRDVEEDLRIPHLWKRK